MAESIIRARVWEAVPYFNERTATGRVVVNPPEKRGEVKPHATFEAWYFCKCGRAFLNVDRYVEHKNSGCAGRLAVSKPKRVTSITIARRADDTYQIVKDAKGSSGRRRDREQGSCNGVVSSRISSVPKKTAGITRKKSEKSEGNELIQCNKCEKTFAEIRHYRIHYHKMHNRPDAQVGGLITMMSDGSTGSQETSKETRRNERIQCNKCEKSFGEIRNYRIHYYKMHQRPAHLKESHLVSEGSASSRQDTAEETEIVEKIQCNKCDRSFDAIRNYRIHCFMKHRNRRAKFYSARKTPVNLPVRAYRATKGPVKRCEQCNIGFANEIGYFHHMLGKHDGMNLFKCEHCDFKTLRQDKLYLHVKRLHSALRPASFHLSLRQKKEKPEKDASPKDPSLVCTESLEDSDIVSDGGAAPGGETTEKVRTPVKIVDLPQGKKRQPRCRWCFLSFVSSSQLHDHLSKYHRIDRRILRPSRGEENRHEVTRLSQDEGIAENTNKLRDSLEAVVSRSNRRRPRKEEPGLRLHPDNLTAAAKTTEFEVRLDVDHLYGTVAKDQLNSAMRQPKFACDHCQRVCDSKRGLSHHIRHKHTNKPGTEDTDSSQSQGQQDNKEDNSVSGFSKDDFHQQSFSDELVTKETVEKVAEKPATPLKTRMVDNSKQPFCTECNRYFKTALQLRWHKYYHTRRFVCRRCGARFLTNKKLEAHVQTAHVPGGKYPCRKCSCVYANNCGLASHMRNAHTTMNRASGCKLSVADADPWNPKSPRKTDTAEVPFIPNRSSARLLPKIKYFGSTRSRLLPQTLQKSSVLAQKKSPVKVVNSVRTTRAKASAIGTPSKVSSKEVICSTQPPKSPKPRDSGDSSVASKSEDASNEQENMLEEFTIKNIVYVYCNACHLKVPKIRLELHKKNAHSGGEYACDQCTCSFRYNQSLIIHKRQRHQVQGGKKPVATITPAPTNEVETEKKSPESGPVSQVAEEDKPAPATKKLSPLRSLICSLCKLTIRGGVRGMLEHKQTAHAPAGAFNCPSCSCKFRDRRALVLHMTAFDHSRRRGKSEKQDPSKESPKLKLITQFATTPNGVIADVDRNVLTATQTPKEARAEGVPSIVSVVSQNIESMKRLSLENPPNNSKTPTRTGKNAESKIQEVLPTAEGSFQGRISTRSSNLKSQEKAPGSAVNETRPKREKRKAALKVSSMNLNEDSADEEVVVTGEVKGKKTSTPSKGSGSINPSTSQPNVQVEPASQESKKKSLLPPPPPEVSTSQAEFTLPEHLGPESLILPPQVALISPNKPSSATKQGLTIIRTSPMISSNAKLLSLSEIRSAVPSEPHIDLKVLANSDLNVGSVVRQNRSEDSYQAEIRSALQKIGQRPDVSLIPITQNTKGETVGPNGTTSAGVEVKPLPKMSNGGSHHTRAASINSSSNKTRLAVCHTCKKSFFNKDRLTEHVKVCQAQQSTTAKCGYCGKNLAHDKLPEHMKVCQTQHSSVGLQSSTGKCGYCGKNFTQGILVPHMLECGKMKLSSAMP